MTLPDLQAGGGVGELPHILGQLVNADEYRWRRKLGNLARSRIHHGLAGFYEFAVKSACLFRSPGILNQRLILCEHRFRVLARDANEALADLSIWVGQQAVLANRRRNHASTPTTNRADRK